MEELGQCWELIGSIAKAMALIAPKLTKQVRQSWIGLPPVDFAPVLERQIFLPTEREHVDLDADPFVPDSWSVEEHQKGGQFTWDAAKVSLYLSKKQQNGKGIEGNKLREELKDRPVFNANLLDYLLAHTHLIPEEWKGKAVFFWGTIYRDRDGDLRVRCLIWGDGRWLWNALWLCLGWRARHPAAVPAS
jgi:hypothetical protein